MRGGNSYIHLGTTRWCSRGYISLHVAFRVPLAPGVAVTADVSDDGVDDGV